jgi:hypothetical protein
MEVSAESYVVVYIGAVTCALVSLMLSMADYYWSSRGRTLRVEQLA